MVRQRGEACVLGKQCELPYKMSRPRALERIQSHISGGMLDVFSCSNLFKSMAETRFGRKLANLRSDKGGEYLYNNQRKLFSENCIVIQLTNGLCPRQSNVTAALRKNLVP